MPAPSYHQPSMASASTRTAIGIAVVAVAGQGGDVDVERRVAAPVAVDHGAVHPDGAEGGHAVELKFDVLAAIVRIELESLSIPADAAARNPWARLFFSIDRPPDRPIVGKIDLGPVAVVDISWPPRPARCRPWRCCTNRRVPVITGKGISPRWNRQPSSNESRSRGLASGDAARRPARKPRW